MELQPVEENQQIENQFVELIDEWQVNPLRYCVEALGVKPTTQQTEALMELGKLVTAKMKKWKKQPLTPEEEHYAGLVGLSIMSGKGTGKDAFLAWCCWWFHTCFYSSKVPLTGPSRDQLRDVLLSEMSKWANRLDEHGEPCFIFRDNVVIQADKIYSKDPERPEDEGKNWFIRLRTAPKNSTEEQQSKNMDGLHEDFMMIGIDEADGVPQPILTSLETTLTGPVNFILMIFNPTKNYGYAYETQFSPNRSQYWKTLHWDSRFSENVDISQIEKIKNIYGENSYEYRVNVLGLPPEQSENTLIPQEWIDNAIDRDITPSPEALRVMGVDPSRQGGDPAACLIRDAHKIRDFIEFTRLDTVELADEIAQVFIEWECDIMYIDIIGNGAGVYDLLKRRFPGKVKGVDVSTRPRDDRKKFNRLRDELCWLVREQFEQGLVSIPSSHRLTRKFRQELAVMQRDASDEDSGKIKIESKSKMKSRGILSPNLFDAYMVTMADRGRSYMSVNSDKIDRRVRDPYSSDDDDLYTNDRYSWMTV